MRASDSPNLKDHDRSTFRRLLTTMIAVLVLATATVSMLLFPLLLGRLFAATSGDYSRISDIGQAYGAASAMISAGALGVVVFGQHRQVRRTRLQVLSETTDDLVQLAMDEPMYRQCWGSRMAPDDIDEALFYYCNRMIKSWKVAWELHDLPEAQARAYLARFFEGEIPRLFWKQHGVLQMSAKRTNQRARFVVLINEEYLRAINAGPPKRAREYVQPNRRVAKPPRRHLVDADNINDRPTVT
jgi:uncharacterized protein DUF6082